MNVIQTAIPPSVNNANDTDVDVTNFDEVLELTLTWLLEAQDGLSQQQPVSDNVTTVKEQFQKHEVSCRETCDVSRHLLPSVELTFNLASVTDDVTFVGKVSGQR